MKRKKPSLWDDFFFSGVGDGTRTHNAWNHNPVLCQLNYTHHMKLNWHARRDSLTFPLCGKQCSARSSPRRQRSSALHFIVRIHWNMAQKNGTPGGIRTPDLLLRRQLLYPAELLAHFDGAGDGNRTRVSSLEGWCSTIELHPRIRYLAVYSHKILAYEIRFVKVYFGNNGIFILTSGLYST